MLPDTSSSPAPAAARGAGVPGLTIGQVVSSKYAVLRRIGQGGMGTVYEAENLSIGRRVAIKVLDPALSHLPDTLTRFRREGRAAARIGHPNILDVLDMGVSEQGLPYIVMELLDGFDLSRLTASAPLDSDVAVGILLDVLAALQATHAAGIVHRDLKPENIFVAHGEGDDQVVKVIDFGIARSLDGGETRITGQGVVIGTATYMSPEQAQGAETIDHRSDLYSAGLILYEMLSGHAPYRGHSYNAVIWAIASSDPAPLRRVAPWVDRQLASVVRRAMARHPEARFQDAAAFAEALRPFAGPRRRLVLPEDPGPGRRDLGTAGPTRADTQRSRRGSRHWVLLLAVWAALWIAGFFWWQRVPGAHPVSRSAASGLDATLLGLDATGGAHRARVLLDGELLGTSPLAVKVKRKPGRHLLRVEAEGFIPSEHRIPLERSIHVVVNLASDGHSLDEQR